MTRPTVAYPPAPRDDAIVDDFHGTRVPDPYRALEIADAPATVAWVDAQNKLTVDFVAGPAREAIRARLTEVWNYPRYSVPRHRGGRYFFRKNDGLQAQSVLYVQEGMEGRPRVLIDPNSLSADGTVALQLQRLTKDGQLMAYGLSRSGSDRQDVLIRDVTTGKDLPDVIAGLKFPNVAWRNDNAGFFYNRYPAAGSVSETEASKNSRIYYHQLGTPTESDALVLETPEHAEWDKWPGVSDDGRYLIVNLAEGTDPRQRVYVRPISANPKLGVDADKPFVKLLDAGDAAYDIVEIVGDVLYVHTNVDAPRGKIIAINLKTPSKEKWRTIVPEGKDALAFTAFINRQLVLGYLHDAYSQLKIYGLDGALIREVPLPGIGSVGEVTGEPEDGEMFFSFTSYLWPTSAFRYNFKTADPSIFRKSEVKFDTTTYETKQIFATSKDGTKVPVFVTHKKGIALDGSHPALLEGYGGFNVSITPNFSTGLTVWLEAGGVHAEAVLRGGDEYGEAWHQAGMLGNKQNVFDDFQAAAAELARPGYTNPSRLAIEGGSNGGLLVSACMIQRPELFGAVLCGVPVTDMLRYHQFTVGRFWIPEYGNAEDAAHFKWLYAYSPLHNVRPGAKYPPILVTTADTDDRVSPAHAKKLVATLQAANPGGSPVLLRVETKAGHGAGKPTAKLIDELSDRYAFLFRVFGMKAPE